MFKLIIMTNVIPRSLYITDVKADIDQRALAIGGFGSVFKGEFAGQFVAVKVLNTVRHQEVSRHYLQLPNAKTLIHLQRVRSKAIFVRKPLRGDQFRIALSFLCWGYMKRNHRYS